MLSVLLIDDEDLELEGLETMIKGMNLEFQVCGKARNAVSGIEMAKALHPDIILSDVKMPKMDGIEMAREMKRLGIQSFLVFISGYQDFAAAQSAIQLGVKAYLLKPVNCDSLRDILLQASDSFEKSQQELRHKQQVDSSLLRLEDFQKFQFIKQLMARHSMSEEEISQSMERLGLPCTRGHYAVGVLKQKQEDDCDGFLGGESVLQLEAVAAKHNAFSPAILSEGEIGFVFYFPSFVTEEQMLNYLMTAGEAILREGKALFGENLNMGISGVTDSLLELWKLTAQSRRTLEHAFYFGCGKVVLYEGENEVTAQIPEHFFDEVKGIFTAVGDGDKRLAIENLDRLFHQKWFSSREIVSSTCIDMISFSQRLLEEAKLSIPREVADQVSYVELLRQTTFSQTFEYMKSYLKILCDLFSDKSQKQGNTLVEQIEQIIESECHLPLSIDSIAARVYMSASYISRVFKNHTGETILDYLQAVRMKKALEYLGRPQYHIYEIGTMVGYENPSYFAMVFKKYYGITPKKYREQMNIYENV